jgi:hypothetical protein
MRLSNPISMSFTTKKGLWEDDIVVKTKLAHLTVSPSMAKPFRTKLSPYEIVTACSSGASRLTIVSQKCASESADRLLTTSCNQPLLDGDETCHQPPVK